MKVSWELVTEYVNEIYKRYKGKISGVYGIPSGGLPLAVMISKKLDVPLLLAPFKNCLIVDDITDSGKSLSHYLINDTQFNKYLISTMYYHKRSIVIPDFYFKEKNNEWIEFPWE